MDVVGVVTSLVRQGAQVVLHGDQVVVEREESEVKEKRSFMAILLFTVVFNLCYSGPNFF